MIQIIRVASNNEGEDSKGKAIQQDLKNHAISKIRTVRLYRLEGIDIKQAKEIAEHLLCETINQNYSLNSPLIKNPSKIIEIAYKPGVMNPEVASIIKSAKDMGITLKAADSTWEHNFFGTINQNALLTSLKNLRVYNPTVEYIVKESPTTLSIKGNVGITITIPIQSMSDTELMALSKDKLFLNLEEMKVIQDYYKKEKRDPTDCELETLAQTWSEHCAHKTFKANLIIDGKKKTPLIKRIQKEAFKHNKYTVSAFVDNSGVMDFYDGMAICGKVETHNSPSAIEPYGGAMTGSGGVFRDVLGTGLGAKTIASTDIFCFAEPSLPLSELPLGCLPPEYLLKRVIMGVRDYGNRMGIPTNNGSVHFHNDFRAKPTVIVGGYGLIPTKKAKKGRVKKGDVVVAVGGRTGRDGIHGATFSSAEMTDKTININASAVQIGNPIEEKRMFDAILEARDNNLIQAIQDCGAGGFSSAVGELGEETGVNVDLSKAPLKYQGLAPWEIWVSESQERMIVAVSKKNIKRFITICKKNNVETAILGKFDGSKKLKLYYDGKLICSLDMEFLHHGLPQRTMIGKYPKINKHKDSLVESPKSETEWLNLLKKVLSHGNVASKEPIVRQYDHTVQGTSVMQPYSGIQLEGPTDAAVMRPLLNKSYGMIISHGLNPILNKIDPYWGSIWSSVEALSNYVAVGGDYKNSSLINNYIWPFPDEESLWELDKSVDAVIDVMKAFKIPVISGKDSLSSTYRGEDGKVLKIPPVLCMSVFGRISDIKKTISSDFKKEGSYIYLLGKLDTGAMAGSIYNVVNNLHNIKVPKMDIAALARQFTYLYENIQKNAILSCHDISEGGLITSIFEMCVGGNIGAVIEVPQKEKHHHFLFNETAGCFIVEIEKKDDAEQLFKNIPYILLGITRKKRTIFVEQKTQKLFEADIQKMKDIWLEPMKKIFN